MQLLMTGSEWVRALVAVVAGRGQANMEGQDWCLWNDRVPG